MNKKLTAKQKRFADLYIDSCNAAQTYLEVYQCKSKAAARVSASKLLTNPNIKNYIRDRRAVIDSKVLKRQIFTKERTLQEETRIASSDIRKIYDENGEIKIESIIEPGGAHSVGRTMAKGEMYSEDPNLLFITSLYALRNIA